MTPGAGRAGRAPRAQGERRREAIVAAACALLERDGFGAVRHRAVARDAGVPLGATTYYFASREELAAEAMRAMCEPFVAHARQLAEAAPDPRRLPGRLVEMVAGPPGRHARRRLLAFYERYAQAGRSELVAAVARGTTAELIALVERVLVLHGVGDATRSARHAVALIDGLLLVRLTEPGGDPVAGLAGEVAALLERYGCERPDRASDGPMCDLKTDLVPASQAGGRTSA